MRLKCKEISIPLYPSRLYWLQGEREAVFAQMIKWDPEFAAFPNRGTGKCWNSDGHKLAIWIDPEVPVGCPLWWNIAAHEITHATLYILNRVGMGLSEDGVSDEAYTYLLGYLIEQVAIVNGIKGRRSAV